MLYGRAGANLEIDLSRGNIEKKELDRGLDEAFLGGKGTNAKILWDRVPPEVEPFSPDNLLIFGTGILCGTTVPSANHTIVTFKSPINNLHRCSAFGGFFAPELKYAGYDRVIIAGKSPTPVYLWINDDQVEIRDASHLWGKDTRETQKLIKEELEIDEVQIISIGLAGENRVYAASIEHSNGASASRGGVGAVMGDKKLKAIAVHGTKDINVANGARLFELCEQIQNNTDIGRANWKDAFETMAGGFIYLGAYGYWGEPTSPEFRKSVKDHSPMFTAYRDTTRVRDVACYNCGLRCKSVYSRPNGDYAFIKCFSYSCPIIATQIFDTDFMMTFYELCEKYGFDTMSISTSILFAIDLYQRGILTKEDTDGMELESGNAELALSLVEKIARREGIGDILANGVYRAAQQIGKGAEDRVITIKKYDPIPWEVRGNRSALALSISDSSDTTRLVSGLDMVWSGRSKADREAAIKSGQLGYPERITKYLERDFDYTEQDPEPEIQIMNYDEETYLLCDMTGICYYWAAWFPFPPINSRTMIADLISSATGMIIDEAEATKIATRVRTLVRAYNVREGIRKKDDTIPDRLFDRAPQVPPHGKPDRDSFNKWRDRWYELKGWDSEGIPTRKTLEELGLDDVVQDLERRGILTGVSPILTSRR